MAIGPVVSNGIHPNKTETTTLMVKDGELSCRPRLGGLLRYYYRDAA